MAYNEDGQNKCFTYIWKVKNAAFTWHSTERCVVSPPFIVEEINETKWSLLLYPKNEYADIRWLDVKESDVGKIGLYLQREADGRGLDNVKIDYELAFMLSDGSTVEKLERVTEIFFQGKVCLKGFLLSPTDVFGKRIDLFMTQETLTIRCRIWKSDGEISKGVQCVARTRFIIEKRSFVWETMDPRSLLSAEDKQSYKVKSLTTGDELMTLEMQGIGSDKAIHFEVTSRKIMSCSIVLFAVTPPGVATQMSEGTWLVFHAAGEKQCFSESNLMGKKCKYFSMYLMRFLCECKFYTGGFVEEIEEININTLKFEKIGIKNRCWDERYELAGHKTFLSGNFKSILDNGVLSDVKLKTSSKTYPAHKCVLGARSPVFKAMFSSNMKEKISGCVEVKDVNDDTMARMLRYIYSAEIEELDWYSATQLYEAADKYEILPLREVCSTYMEDNLCRQNVHEALALADLHEDENLKGKIQRFIVKQGRNLVLSDEWGPIMKLNLEIRLLAEAKRLKSTE